MKKCIVYHVKGISVQDKSTECFRKVIKWKKEKKKQQNKTNKKTRKPEDNFFGIYRNGHLNRNINQAC